MGEKNVQLPDGKVVAFPDTVSDDAISAVIRKQLGQDTTSPEVEALRQRNMANAMNQSASPFTRSMQNIGEAARAPYNAISQGYEQAKTRPLAGGLNMLAGVLSTPFSAPSAVVQGLREIPPVAGVNVGGPTADVLTAVPWLINKGVETATRGVDWGLGKVGLAGSPSPESQALNNVNQTIAQYLVPSVAKEAVSGFKNARQTTADALSQSAIKVPPSVKAGERMDMLHTSQKYAITPTKAGIDRLDSKVGELKSFAEDMENKAQSTAGKVPTQDVLSSLNDLRDKWAKSDTPKDFTDIIDNYSKKVLQQKQPELSLDDMIDLKRNLQNQLSNVYQKQMKLNPTMRETVLQEAKSKVEQTVRQQLEGLIPGYGDVNSQIHKILKLKPFIEQATNRISNQDLASIRLKDILFGTAGLGVQNTAYGAAGAIVLGKVLTDPRIQAYIANKIAPRDATGIGRYVPQAPFAQQPDDQK